MNLPLKIARRYFFSKKREGGINLINIISGISLLGYIVGAAALIIVLSVFNGFESLFASFYTNFDSDIRITPIEGKHIRNDEINWAAFNKIEGIETYARVIEENVLLRYNNQQSIATLKGVDTNYVKVTHYDSIIISGYVDVRHDSIYAIVGQGLAYQLSIDPNNLFKPLAIYVPKRETQTLINAENAFNKSLVMPSGVFSVQEDVDNKYVICPIGFAQALLEKENDFSAIEIRVKKGYSVDKIKSEIAQITNNAFTIKNRFEQREAYYKVMRSEKAISFIILFFILLIAASNTISSLYILVMEKKRDLLLFKSMGLTEDQAKGIFRYEGLLIAVAGGIIGIVLGLLLCFLQEYFGLIALEGASQVSFSAYPVKVNWVDVIIVFFTVVVLGFLTTVYPAQKAKQVVAD